MQGFSCDTWHWRPLTRWWFKKKKKKKQAREKEKEEEEDVQTEQRLLFFLFIATVCPPPPYFPEGPSSARLRACHPFWNMQIADSAFACWCLTFPLEVAHRLNYAPLSAVCLKTPVILPQSATLRQSHFSASRPPRVCLEAVWTRWGRLRWGVGGRMGLGERRGSSGEPVMAKFDMRCGASFLLRPVSENCLCQYHFL